MKSSPQDLKRLLWYAAQIIEPCVVHRELWANHPTYPDSSHRLLRNVSIGQRFSKGIYSDVA